MMGLDTSASLVQTLHNKAYRNAGSSKNVKTVQPRPNSCIHVGHTAAASGDSREAHYNCFKADFCCLLALLLFKMYSLSRREYD